MSWKWQFCSAFHFFGEKNTLVGSTMSSSKFSNCCSNGQVTSHFMLDSLCYFFLQNFAVFEDSPVNQKWVNLVLAVVLSYSKFCRPLLSHHSPCLNYLHQIPLKLDISARIYVTTIVHGLWHLCELICCSRPWKFKVQPNNYRAQSYVSWSGRSHTIYWKKSLDLLLYTFMTPKTLFLIEDL